MQEIAKGLGFLTALPFQTTHPKPNREPSGPCAGHLVIGDDLFAGNEFTCQVYRWSEPDGYVEVFGAVGLGAGFTCRDVVLGDFDGDGKADIAVAARWFYVVMKADGEVMWAFEPHVAEQIFEGLIEEHGITVLDVTGTGGQAVTLIGGFVYQMQNRHVLSP